METDFWVFPKQFWFLELPCLKASYHIYQPFKFMLSVQESEIAYVNTREE